MRIYANIKIVLQHVQVLIETVDQQVAALASLCRSERLGTVAILLGPSPHRAREAYLISFPHSPSLSFGVHALKKGFPAPDSVRPAGASRHSLGLPNSVQHAHEIGVYKDNGDCNCPAQPVPSSNQPPSSCHTSKQIQDAGKKLIRQG